MNIKLFTVPFLAVILAGAAFLSCAKTIHAPFLMDDSYKIVNNRDIRGDMRMVLSRLVYPYDRAHWSAARNDPSRPLLFLSFALNYRFGGLDPTGYHAVNLLLHAANTVLVFLFLRFVFLQVFGLSGIFIPFFVAFLFGVHPANSYTVNYVFCRSDLLATFFSLGALCSWLCLPRKGWRAALAYLSIIAALLSKQSAIMTPALIMLTDALRIDRAEWKNVRGFLRTYAGFFLIVLAYLSWRWHFFGGLGDQEALKSWTGYHYLIVQPYAVARYAQYLIVPVGLCFYHCFTPVAFLSAKVIYPLIGWIVAFFSVAALVCRFPGFRRIAAWCCGWFLLALLPTSSIFPTTNVIVENRLYFAGLGVLAAIGLGYDCLRRLARDRAVIKILVLVVMAFHLAFFFMLTRLRSELYAQPILLWDDVLTSYPDSYIAYAERGLIFAGADMFDRAGEELAIAVRLNPGYAEGWMNLGAVCIYRDDYTGAAAATRMAVSLNHGLTKGYANLGDIYRNLNDDDSALRYYTAAVTRDPRCVEAWNGFGEIKLQRREYIAAAEAFDRALAIAPDLERARKNRERTQQLIDVEALIKEKISHR